MSNTSKVAMDLSNKSLKISNDLLFKIFSFLSIEEKSCVSNVCPLWGKLIEKSMASETVLSFGTNNCRKDFEFCSHKSHKTNRLNDLTELIMDSSKRLVFKSSDRLSSIVRIAYNIESLVFVDCFVDTIFLKWIITQTPKLKCLTFDGIEGIEELDWPKLGKPLSAKLTHFCYGGNRINSWKCLTKMVKFFDVLEELSIFNYKQDLESVFINVKQTLLCLKVIQCKQLDVRAIKALTRKNGPKIRELSIDFKVNKCPEDIIDCVYKRIPDLHYLCVKNMNSKIDSFVHRISDNRLTIIFKEDMDLYLISTPVLRSVEFVGITATLKPSSVRSISHLMPNCKELKLIDCHFSCECDSVETTTTPLTDSYHKCDKCFKVTVALMARMPQLIVLNINGTQFCYQY